MSQIDSTTVASIAHMWDARWALGTIERITGVPAARCCKIAKEYWSTRPTEHVRPLVEEHPYTP